MKIKYTGCFFALQQLQECLKAYPRQQLHRTIIHPHITFAYKPVEIPLELFGEKIRVRCIGYACDGENEALEVAFVHLPERLEEDAQKIAVPHITLSVASNGASVNSGRLHFLPIVPFELEGTFGGKDEDGALHLATV